MTEVDESDGDLPMPADEGEPEATTADDEGSKRLPLVVRVLPLTAVIVVIAVIAVLLVRSGDDEGDESTSVDDVASPSSGFVQGETDDFERSGNRTDLTDPGELSWTVERGTWLVDDGVALASSIPNLFSVAVIGTRRPVVGIQARMSRMGQQSGLAFAYAGEDDFLAFLSAPGYGSWGFWSWADGVWTYLAGVGLASVVDDTVVGVVVADGEAQAYLDGEPVGEPLPLGGHSGTGAGLVDFAVSGPRGHFDDVVVATSG